MKHFCPILSRHSDCVKGLFQEENKEKKQKHRKKNLINTRKINMDKHKKQTNIKQTMHKTAKFVTNCMIEHLTSI